jgi:hypothetical protein
LLKQPDKEEVPNDSPQLRENLARVLEEIVRASEQRETPTLAMAKRWQTFVMEGLDVPDSRFVGAFRGEPGLETVQVRVPAMVAAPGPPFRSVIWVDGVDSAGVAEERARFEAKLRILVAELDALLPIGQEPDADQLAAIVDLCAWVHAEWVRIHPFANGNGRTVRLWANSLAMRYGLPPFIRLRPRPTADYGDAGAKAMQGD